jgi:hypothetical protein
MVCFSYLALCQGSVGMLTCCHDDNCSTCVPGNKEILYSQPDVYKVVGKLKFKINVFIKIVG